MSSYPVEGYVYNEPHGRPRPGIRYRSPGGDRKVLILGVSLFVLICVAVGIFGFVERDNTLTEWALGDNRFACSPENGAINLHLRFDVDKVRKHQPEALDAAGYALAVDVKLLNDRELVRSETGSWTTEGVDWNAKPTYLSIPVDGTGGTPDNPIGICDVELTTLTAAAVPAGAPVVGSNPPSDEDLLRQAAVQVANSN